MEDKRRAIEQLVECYGNALVRYAYCFVRDSALAEDIAEDAFVALLLKKKHFTDDKALKAYLFKIVRNSCIDQFRKRKYVVPLFDVQNVLVADDAQTQIDERCDRETLYLALQKLPPQYRDVLCLCYLEGFSIDEIAKTTKRSKKQVYNLLSRAKTSLSEILKKEGLS